MNFWIMACPYHNAADRFLRRMVKEPGYNYRRFTTVEKLVARLQRPVNGDPVLVLFPASRCELESLLETRHLLRDLRIILVLEETTPEFISIGHGLRPRYISYADGDMSDVVAVTAKMTAVQKQVPLYRATA